MDVKKPQGHHMDFLQYATKCMDFGENPFFIYKFMNQCKTSFYIVTMTKITSSSNLYLTSLTLKK